MANEKYRVAREVSNNNGKTHAREGHQYRWKKATSALYNDIVTPSIAKEIIAETSAIRNFADKKYE